MQATPKPPIEKLVVFATPADLEVEIEGLRDAMKRYAGEVATALDAVLARDLDGMDSRVLLESMRNRAQSIYRTLGGDRR